MNFYSSATDQPTYQQSAQQRIPRNQAQQQVMQNQPMNQYQYPMPPRSQQQFPSSAQQMAQFNRSGVKQQRPGDAQYGNAYQSQYGGDNRLPGISKTGNYNDNSSSMKPGFYEQQSFYPTMQQPPRQQRDLQRIQPRFNDAGRNFQRLRRDPFQQPPDRQSSRLNRPFEKRNGSMNYMERQPQGGYRGEYESVGRGKRIKPIFRGDKRAINKGDKKPKKFLKQTPQRKSDLYKGGDNRPVRTNADFMPNGRNAAPRNQSTHELSSTNIYISGFPSHQNKSQLHDLFAQFGSIIETRVVPPKAGHQEHLATGFVHFAKAECANTACREMDGFEIKDEKTDEGSNNEKSALKLNVRFANQSKNSPPEFLNTMRVNISRLDPNNGSNQSLESSKNIYVSQLPSSWQETDVRNLFSKFGEIENLNVINSTKNDAKGNVAFVHYLTADSATKAIAEMDEHLPSDAKFPIRVRFANISQSNYPQQFEPKYLKIMEATTNVYVAQIPDGQGEKQILDTFSKFGNIKNVTFLGKRKTGNNLSASPQKDASIAFLLFEDEISAVKAVAGMNNTLVNPESKCELSVRFAKVPPGTTGINDDSSSMGFSEDSYYPMPRQPRPLSFNRPMYRSLPPSSSRY